MVGSKHSDRGFEVVERVKGLVDAREPEVRHLVELSERPEDCQADLIGVNLRAPARADRLLDPLGQQSKVVLADRPALASLAHASDDLVPTEGLAVSIVVKRRLHAGHCRRRRIVAPSSEVRESTTRESPCRQKGQCTEHLRSQPGTWRPLHMENALRPDHYI